AWPGAEDDLGGNEFAQLADLVGHSGDRPCCSILWEPQITPKQAVQAFLRLKSCPDAPQVAWWPTAIRISMVIHHEPLEAGHDAVLSTAAIAALAGTNPAAAQPPADSRQHSTGTAQGGDSVAVSPGDPDRRQTG